MHAMKRAIRQILVLAAIAAALPASALADMPDTAIRDCIQDGAVQGHYDDDVLQEAINRIRGDNAVYGDCEDVLGALIGSGAGSQKANTSGKGGPGAKDGRLTPAEKRKAKREKERKRRQIASIDLAPDGSDPLQLDEDTSSGMSLPVLLTLILLACLAAGGGLWYAARRNPAIANALRRVPLPGRRG